LSPEGFEGKLAIFFFFVPIEWRLGSFACSDHSVIEILLISCKSPL